MKILKIFLKKILILTFILVVHLSEEIDILILTVTKSKGSIMKMMRLGKTFTVKTKTEGALQF